MMGADAFLFGASPVMQRLRARVKILAQTDVPVLILGERGSGKDTIVSLIHRLSIRSGFPLVKVRCDESAPVLGEIFTSQQAAGDGIRRPSLEKSALGEKSTLFLDEIHFLPSHLQERLLHVLQANENFETSGGSVLSDVRILAASSEDLDGIGIAHRLREDLYYRLSAFTIQVPPLRQRREEMSLLLDSFMHRLAKQYHMPARAFSATTVECCERYPWPGNLTEMESFVKRYLVAGDRQMPDGNLAVAPDLRHSIMPPSTLTSKFEFGLKTDSVVGPVLPESNVSPMPQTTSLKSLVQGIKSEAERSAIGAALKETGWNRKAAARLLRVSYRTLLYKIEQYQMRPESFVNSPVTQLSAYGPEGSDDGSNG